jgi:hypothetical protein
MFISGDARITSLPSRPGTKVQSGAHPLGECIGPPRASGRFQPVVADIELQNVFIRPFASDLIHRSTLLVRGTDRHALQYQ